MQRLTDDDLWPIIDRLAQQHPDRTDALDEAVLVEAGLGARDIAYYLRVRAIATGSKLTLSDRAVLYFRRARLNGRAALLLGYIAGMEGVTWAQTLQEATARFELLAVEADHQFACERELNGKPRLH